MYWKHLSEMLKSINFATIIMKASEIIIVIGREFGSGGRALGRLLSHRLGMPFYDKELLSEAAKRFGFDRRLIEQADERKPSLLRVLMGSSSCCMTPSAYDYDNSLSPDTLYGVQSRVIRMLADEGPAIFVGRTADYILRERSDMLSIFVHSHLQKRAMHIVERGECDTLEDALDLARRRDRLRESYYNYYTGRRWGSAANYHLCIDMSDMSAEDAADIVILCAEKKARMQDK